MVNHYMNLFKYNFTDYFFDVWNISISEFYPHKNGFFLIGTNGMNYFLKTSNEDPKELERYIYYFNELKKHFPNTCDLIRTKNSKISFNNFYLLSFPNGIKVSAEDQNHKEEIINTFKKYFKACVNVPIGFVRDNNFLDTFIKNKMMLEDRYFEISDKIFKTSIEEKFIRNYFKLHEVLNEHIDKITDMYTELKINSYPENIQYFNVDKMYLSYSDGEVYFVDFSIPTMELRCVSFLKIIKRFNFDPEDFIKRFRPKIFNLEIEFIKLFLSLPLDYMGKYTKYFKGEYINEKDFEKIYLEQR